MTAESLRYYSQFGNQSIKRGRELDQIVRRYLDERATLQRHLFRCPVIPYVRTLLSSLNRLRRIKLTWYSKAEYFSHSAALEAISKGQRPKKPLRAAAIKFRARYLAQIAREYVATLSRGDPRTTKLLEMGQKVMDSQKEIVDNLLPLLTHHCGRSADKNLIDDLMQDLAVILIEAVERFDPNRARVTTCVVGAIKQNTRSTLVAQKHLIHIPDSAHLEALKRGERIDPVASLTTVNPGYHDDDQYQPPDRTDEFQPEVRAGLRERSMIVRRALSHLSEREASMFLDYHVKGITLVQIGKAWKVTKTRAGQIVNNAVPKKLALLCDILRDEDHGSYTDVSPAEIRIKRNRRFLPC